MLFTCINLYKVGEPCFIGEDFINGRMAEWEGLVVMMSFFQNGALTGAQLGPPAPQERLGELSF